ncbi:glutamyl-tRNA amidotransferase subunit A, putative [Pediculus humanus corporis]|uniref:Glutamyl-tRNA amidotransferase subunit A, putative n=1 Tax=Pediculus humanus subsp. corporis TaxID=121224 RepID=E0VQD5_PEDHC|nr:glutamyl-tRNA amidotransferase subunit A, putative [Pediculus humanus corporis]EEB15591.1 glutamyl-tRNA amidotransferase subunit A, putative [Pediculus humanus corporis]
MITKSQILVVGLKVFFETVQLIVRAILWLIFGGKGEKLPPINNSLLLCSATSLAHQIRTKKVTSVEVVQSFIKRIQLVNPILNCVIDDRFEDALEDAKNVDEMIASGKFTTEELETRTPFLGVPFTTKDCISIKGLSCTAGIYSRKGMKGEKDADSIALMKKAGGIPLAVTNVSELCMWWESFNPVYGRTKNPYNTNHIAGGSSGGEGCLLASAGSAMGIGSDIGGSVRIPCFFNGVFGHKPSTGMGSLKGHIPLPSNTMQKSYLVIGPMSRFASDLLPMFKVMASDHVEELKLNEKVDVTKLKYYYMEDDSGSVLTSSVEEEIKEAVRKAAKHFEQVHNAETQRVVLNKLKYSMAIWFAKMRIPEGSQLPVELSNNKGKVNIVKEFIKFPFGLSNHTLPILCIGLMEKLNPEYNSPKHVNFVSMYDGVLIYPTHPTAAPYHNEPLFKPINVGYTAVFNVLGLPSTHCPMGLNSKGLPIGIQVVGALKQDRLTLAVALELEKAFGGWVPPSSLSNSS